MVFDPKRATNAAPIATPAPTPGGGMGGLMGALGGLGRGLTSPQAAPFWGLLLGNTAQAQNQMFSQGMQGLQQHRSQQERLEYAKQRDTVEDARARETAEMNRKKFGMAMEKHKSEIDKQRRMAEARVALIPAIAQSMNVSEDVARNLVTVMDNKTVASLMQPEDATPRSPLGDLTYDARKGFITEEEAERGKKKKLGTDTTVQIQPRLSQDHRPIFDESGNLVGTEAIPGSPAAQEAEKERRAFETKQRETRRRTNLVSERIGHAKKMIKEGNVKFPPVTGLGGALTSNIPGTRAHDLQNVLTTVGVNIGIEELQRMRDSSPTGGAVGQVTEREWAFLMAAQGSIAQSQSEEELLANLDNLEEAFNDVIDGGELSRAVAEGQISPEQAAEAAMKRNGGKADPLGIR